MKKIMKAKRFHSITLQVFFTILPIVLLIFIVQAVFLIEFFTPGYRESMLRDIRKEFNNLVKDYSSSDAYKRSGILRAYTYKYETPILVFDEAYHIINNDFFESMSMLTIRNASFNIYKLPIEDLSELADIDFKEELAVKAQRIGDSNYFEPYLICSGNKTYLYRNDIKSIADESSLITFNVHRTWYTERSGNLINDRAHIIYDLVKGSLINRTDINTNLASISKELVTEKEGVTYQIITGSDTINSLKTYFVTIRPIILSGSEEGYFNKYFYTIFTLFSLLIICVVYFLSRRLSSPIVSLSDVARKLAAQEFSVRAAVKARNEIGQLASNINFLADNLQKAIAESKQAAETAHMNEARVKNLLANLAHELKTPLGIISLYTEVIEKGLYEKEPEHYFHIIEHEIESLTQMIDETIQLTKMYAGYWEYNPAPVELNDLIEAALSRFSEELNREKFALDIRLLDVTVIADGRRIEQVLTNLISNAIKYSGSQKEIEVEVLQNDRAVTVSISNYGNVSEQDLTRIWERYYRADEDTTTHLPSQGIGLEIVREILIMHDSNYGIKQEGGKICFYFSLKIADA